MPVVLNESRCPSCGKFYKDSEGVVQGGAQVCAPCGIAGAVESVVAKQLVQRSLLP
ncbi:MAG: hypothetical protein ACLP74_08455 [Thermoplasmata archaeon]